ncbi:MAG: hypothetical protein AB8F95_08510 [Bacteroidia bacterium]
MRLEDVGILKRADVQAWLTAHRNEDPVQLALSRDRNADLPPIVYSQLKIIQKAVAKLPSWVANSCIIPPRAYEQCSSERAAQLKSWKGARFLDLTCGLGVDTVHFAKNFESLIALEPDPVLHDAVVFNMDKMGLSHVDVRLQKAEDFVAAYEGAKFDLIYVDPDRRAKDGKRHHGPTDGKPDIRALLPRLSAIGNTLLIKASPMYDVSAAQRDFPESKRLIFTSIDGEVKELLIELDWKNENRDAAVICIWCDRSQGEFEYEFPLGSSTVPVIQAVPQVGSYIYEPDAAFYASRTGDKLMRQFFPELEAEMNDRTGFYFSSKYTKHFPGRVFAIRETLAYKPKNLRKLFRKEPHLITQRFFPFSVKTIRQETGIPDGGPHHMIYTSFKKEKIAFITDRVR